MSKKVITVWLISIDDEQPFYSNNLISDLKPYMKGFLDKKGCVVNIKTSTMTQREYDKLPESM